MAAILFAKPASVSKVSRPCLRFPRASTRTSSLLLAIAIATGSHLAFPDSASTAPLSALFACPWLPSDGNRLKSSALSSRTSTSRGHRSATQSPVARQSVGTAEFAAEHDVGKMGLKFVSLPPGKVIVKQAEAGRWAAEQGILAGAELSTINGRRVAEMSKDEFQNAMAGRPIILQMTLDPRELTREITMAASASAVLRVIAPWVDGQHFNMIHMSAAIYRLGLLSEEFTEEIARSHVFQRLIERARGAWNLFDGRAIGNTFWAIAKLRTHVTCFKELLPRLLECLATRGDTMAAQEVANTFWSAAVLKKEVPSLRNLPPGLFKAAHKQAPRMIPQDISNIVWALAVLRLNGEEIPGLLDTLSKEAAEKIGSFKPQDFSNIFWALGVLRPRSEEVQGLIGTMSREAAEKVGSFTPQHLAHMCSGMAKLEVQDHMLMTLIADEVVKRVRLWNRKGLTYDLPEIIWAHARVGLNSSELLEVAAQVLPFAILSVPDWGVCALLWSYIKLDPDKAHADFRKQLKEEASRRSLDTEAVKRARLGPEEWPPA